MAKIKYSNKGRGKGDGDSDDWRPPPRKPTYITFKAKRTREEEREAADRKSNKGQKLNKWTPEQMQRALDM